jgi:hypothetical protein
MQDQQPLIFYGCSENFLQACHHLQGQRGKNTGNLLN